MKIEANATTGEIIEREMTETEIAQDLADQAEATAREAEAATKAAEKSALFAKLGITEDEARLLLG